MKRQKKKATIAIGRAQLKILQISDGVRHVLDISQILPLFQVFQSEAEAIAAFESE